MLNVNVFREHIVMLAMARTREAKNTFLFLIFHNDVTYFIIFFTFNTKCVAHRNQKSAAVNTQRASEEREENTERN